MPTYAQDGFNTLARGFFFHRDPDLRLPVFPDAHTRITLPRGSTSGSGTNDGSERDVGGVGDGNTTGEWAAPRTFRAAYSNTTGVSFLPASMFGNTYTYVNARLWEVGTGTGGGAGLGGRPQRERLRTCRAGGLRRSSHAYGTQPTGVPS